MNDIDITEGAIARELPSEGADPLARLLWTLTRGAEIATALTRRHPRGVEIVVAIGDAVQVSQAFQARRLEDAWALADAVRRDYERQGWTGSGAR